MTVQTNTSTASFAGNGVTTVFPLGFKFNADEDLEVSLVDSETGITTALVLNSDYSVSGAGNDSGGSIATAIAPATGKTLSVARIVEALQLADLRNQGNFFAEVHEDALDLLTMLVQQHADGLNSAIRVAVGDPSPSRLPPALSRANKVMAFDSSGNPTASIPASGSVSELVIDLANAPNPAKGAGMIGWKRSALASAITAGAMLSAQSISLMEFSDLVTVKPTPGDMTTWDWAPAFDACMTQAGITGQDVSLPPIKLKTSKTVTVPKGVIVRGQGGGGYITEIVDTAAWRTVVTKTGGNTNGNSVFTLGEAAQLWDVQVAPEDRSFALWDAANYIIGSGNCDYGVIMGEASRCHGVTAIAFPGAGFLMGMIVKCVDCYAFMNQYGYLANLDEGDASLVECIGMFNYEAGAWLRGGYWKVLGGRWEWNSRYGVVTGSSACISAATFDRNGFSGVYIPTGMPGNTITGCVFRRNGAGGDGAVGRTSWMTPAEDGYVYTDPVNSSHIRWDGSERTTFAGNYFSPGKDDSGGGADAPRHVYTCGAANGTIPLDNLNVLGNSGDRDELWPGYAPAYNGGGAATWGGSELRMIQYFGRKGTYVNHELRSEAFKGSVPSPSALVLNVVIAVPKGTSGRIQLRMSQAGAAEYGEIFFATNSLGTGYSTSYTNIFGVNITSVSMGAGTAQHDYVTVNFVASCFPRYSVVCA